MADIAEETKVELAPGLLAKLRDEWMAAQGAAQTAEAAAQVARNAFQQYQQHVEAALEALGHDTKKQWYVKFDEGVVSDKAPPQQQGQNGFTPQLGN